jgi:hypothetical protein
MANNPAPQLADLIRALLEATPARAPESDDVGKKSTWIEVTPAPCDLKSQYAER